MTQFHKRNSLGFALMWIGIYVGSLCLADAPSQAIGVEKLLTAPLCLALTAVLFCWLRKSTPCWKLTALPILWAACARGCITGRCC